MLKRLLVLVIILLINSCAGNLSEQKAEEKITRAGITPPHNIAVMLPLKGKGELAATSQAINNGLLAAYYSSKQQSNINIHIIDTSDGDVSYLYQQAIANGAEVVIGPLTKPEVESISSIKPLPVPTIALNTLDDYQHHVVDNLYQFGLLPQDEAAQVAVKMQQERLNNVAVIVPESAWGEKIAVAFENQYKSSEGQVSATLKYSAGRNLAEQVCNFLAKDAATMCVPQQHKNKKQVISHEMRRQDIDSIFLVAISPAQARLIVPLLKFYYASDLPIYSISTLYSGNSGPDLNQDINDVYFCDMPWVIQNPNSLNANLKAIHERITATALWANSFANYSKFYALGVDAYNLAIELNTLLSASHVGIEGASGTLYLDDSNHIYRSLQWAQVKDNVVQGF
ncbi:MAG: penicillin-binding protein activator [bacterium]